MQMHHGIQERFAWQRAFRRPGRMLLSWRVQGPGPVAVDRVEAARLLLGVRLARLREQPPAGREVTQREAGAALGGSASKLSRLERAETGAQLEDVESLADLYGVTGQDREELLTLARRALGQRWWDRGSSAYLVPGRARADLSLEAAADQLFVTDMIAVPALLQTSGYARAACGAGPWRAGLDARSLARRRALLADPGRPRVVAVLAAAVLRRAPGGDHDELHRQAEHLLLMAEHGATIRVIPDEAPELAALPGPYTLLGFGHADLPDVVLTETALGTARIDSPDEVARYAELRDMLLNAALDPEASGQLLAAASGTPPHGTRAE